MKPVEIIHNGPMNRISHTIPAAIAILLGIAIPALILGRAAFAGILAVTLILIFLDMPTRQIWRDLVTQARQPLGLLLLTVFALSLPSLFASDFPFRSFEALARTIVYCGLGVIIWSYLKSRPNLAPVWLRAFVYSSTVAIGFGLFSQYVSPAPYWLLHLKGWRPDPLIMALKGYSALSVLIVPLLIYAAHKMRDVSSLIAIVAAFCFLLLDWQLASRAAIAGLLSAILCVAIAICARVGSKLQVFFAAGFAILSFSSILWWLRITRGRMMLPAPDGNYFLPVWLIDFQRQTIWEHALEIALRTPWFGRGANTINFAPGADQHLEGTSLNVIPAHPHNWPLELFAEVGILSLSVLLVFLLVWTFKIIRTYRNGGEAHILCSFTLFSGYWTSGLFNFSFWSSWWQLAFILATALAFSDITQRNAKR